MERLFELLEHPAGVAAQDRPMLQQLADRYPWFVHPRLLLLRLAEREGDEQAAERIRNRLSVRLLLNPTPALLLDGPDWSGWQHRGMREMIDDFLAVEDKRIVADHAQVAGEDLALPQGIDEDAVSETLAGIYAAQGLVDQAGAIYRRLSLKFPEKSVYFADRISELTENK